LKPGSPPKPKRLRGSADIRSEDSVLPFGRPRPSPVLKTYYSIASSGAHLSNHVAGAGHRIVLCANALQQFQRLREQWMFNEANSRSLPQNLTDTHKVHNIDRTSQ
jgi:hypothetical protein